MNLECFISKIYCGTCIKLLMLPGCPHERLPEEFVCHEYEMNESCFDLKSRLKDTLDVIYLGIKV